MRITFGERGVNAQPNHGILKKFEKLFMDDME